MTAKKKTEEPDEIPASQPAEAEKDVVGEAKPAERTDAVTVADQLAQSLKDAEIDATANGNRVTFTVGGPNGLVQTFHATVEAGVAEF